MKGTILGFSAGSGEGAISGEGGGRYKFNAAAWRGDSSPAIGADVDFDAAADGTAQDIYPALASRGMAGLSFDSQSLPPAAGNALAIAKSRPIVWTALIGLLASLFLTFVTISAGIPGLGQEAGTGNLTGDSTVLGLGGKIGAAQDMIGFVERAAGAAGALEDPETLSFLSSLKSFGGFLNVLYLVYLTPLLAVAVLYFEITRKPDRRINLAFAGSSVVSVAIILFLQNRIDAAIAGVQEAMPYGGEFAGLISGSDIVSLGLAAWLILLAGLAAFAITFNLIKIKTA